jgi:cytoskeletal protein CcmA (bactofilin family)
MAVNGFDGSTNVTGTVTAGENLRIDGRVKGTINVKDATLTIEPDARIDAHVHGLRVVVLGSVRGSIVATERIELTATAAVTGSLSAAQVVVADGALFDGAIDMARRTVALKVGTYHDKMKR